jgi:lecithin-cholesterol acyltransferase
MIARSNEEMKMNKIVIGLLAGMALLAPLEMATDRVASAHEGSPMLTPVVVFPAFHFTKLLVNANNQTVAPECPASGSFEDWYQNDNPGTEFGQVCQDKLLTMVYNPSASVPMPERFSNQPGVTVEILDFGMTESAPYYEPLYAFLEDAGYTRNANIRVAGYDSRTTPDMDGFLERTIALIEETYHQNQDTPVHLVAHSNGPLYAHYLLTHTSQSWKNKYIHGFSPFAGNWPGQGLLYPAYFIGLNITHFSFPEDPANAASSAAMYQSHPSSYMSSSDPKVFGSQEVVMQAGNKEYTPADYEELFEDAGLPLSAELASYYIGFVKFRRPAFFPKVDVYAEKGSGIETMVGVGLQDLRVGQMFSEATAVFTRDGDGNQEDLTNDSIQVWEKMHCFRFSLTDNPGVDHFTLTRDEGVLQRLLNNLRRERSRCPLSHD